MLRNNKTQPKNNVRAGESSLLTLRLINSLPLVNTAKGYYQRTKESNEYLKSGLDYAEGSILNISAPLLKRYTKIDTYVASRLEPFEETISGLVLQARSKASDITSPLVDKIYNVADGVVDNLLPAEAGEYDSAELKNPVRRIRRRTNVRSIRALPSNTLRYSFQTAKNVSFYSADVLASKFLLKSLFLQIEGTLHLLDRLERVSTYLPVAAYYKDSEFSQLALVQKSEILLNDLLLNIFSRSETVQDVLKNKKLPKSAALLEHLTSDLHKVTSFVGLGVQKQINFPQGSQKKSHHANKFATKLFPHKQARVQLQSASKKPAVKPFLGDQRMPTFFSGEDLLEHIEEKENDRTASLMGASEPAAAKASKPTKTTSPKSSAVNPATLQRALSRNLLMPTRRACPATPANSPANWILASRAGSIISIADESDQPSTAEVIVEPLSRSSDSTPLSDSGAESIAQSTDSIAQSTDSAWEEPKHPIHAHKEEHTMSKKEVPEIVLNANNPFAALGQASV